MKLFSILFFTAFSFTAAQTVNLQIKGCEDFDKENERLTEICEAKSFNILFYNDLNHDYIRNSNRQFTGNAIVQMVILEDGNIGEIKHILNNNKTLATYGTKVLNNIKADFKKYDLVFEPVLNQETGLPMKFTHIIPVQLQH